MVCYYHPERESTDVCAICGKSVCKECGLEIAGKIYCKECLEKIIGIGLTNTASEKSEAVSEPKEPDKQPVHDSIYQTTHENFDTASPKTYRRENVPVESKTISDDSPYNINYSENTPSSNLYEAEIPKQEEITPNEIKQPQQLPQKNIPNEGFTSQSPSYEPQPMESLTIEDKYEKYLDDLYFDENEIPLNEQLARDEEEYGSLTRKPYKPRKEEPVETLKSNEKIKTKFDIDKEIEKPTHNLNYPEKEPLGAVDIILTIILIIVILIVVYYIIYIFVLSSTYTTFLDAVRALANPQNVINNILK